MQTFNKKLSYLFLLLSVVFVGMISTISSASAAPVTLTVNVVSDEADASPGDGICETVNTGECTFRAALEEANANVGSDTIEFNIPGNNSDVHVITPQIPLPNITDEVHINGYSQPGSSENTAVSPNPINSEIRIELDGHVAAANQNAAVGFLPGSDNSSVRGLSIYDFSTLDGANSSGVNVFIGASNITVAGNYLGLHSDGTTVGSNGNHSSVYITQVADPISNEIIGGDSPQDRNIIYNYSPSNISAGIMGSAPGSVIYGNYFGIAKDGVTDLTTDAADTIGISGPYTIAINLVNGGSTTVGGPATGQGNLISGGTVAVVLSSNGNKVQGNLIGTDYTGLVNPNITNGLGISVTAGNHNLIGGTGVGEGNTIAGSSGAGIAVSEFLVENVGGPGVPMTLTPLSESIIGNSIYDINLFDFNSSMEAFGNMNQGIDNVKMIDTSEVSDFRPDAVELRGPTLNDIGDTDSGPNNQLNYPVLKSAQQIGQNLTITYDLDVAGSPTDDYRVEFFANDKSTIFGYGPGQTFLGAVTQSSGNSKSSTINLGSTDVVGKSLSATVTVIDSGETFGYGDTSEFAQNISVGSASDFDSDGISDTIENGAPNGGDGNNDGIDDYLQPTVSSYEISNTSTYTTFVTEGCSENGTVSSLSQDNLNAVDGNYEYPFGLTDFTLNCSRGATVDVSKYIYTDTSAQGMSVRKYRPNASQHFLAVDNGEVTNSTIGSQDVLVMTYSLTDGSSLDDDGEVNGVIVDPIGIATVKVSSTTSNNNSNTSKNKASGTLASTGSNSLNIQLVYAYTTLILGLSFVLISKSKKRYLLKIVSGF
ncbi:MAG: choice-of-anchor U domain-containing protein [Acidimicrobiia bacterium]